MQGRIRSYLPDQGYGFIHGDDGRDFLFRREAFLVLPPQACVGEDALVAFEPRATPRGYRADRVALVDEATITTFLVPEGVVTSRSGQVKGWDVLERGDWIVHASTRGSADDTWSILRSRARDLGANALLEVSYDRTTDSIGHYYFSVHHVRGRVAVVGRRHARGAHQEADLLGLDERARWAKHQLEDEAKAARRRWHRKVSWRRGAALAMVSLSIAMVWMDGFSGFLSARGALLVMGAILAFRALIIFFEGADRVDDWLGYRPAPPETDTGMRASR